MNTSYGCFLYKNFDGQFKLISCNEPLNLQISIQKNLTKYEGKIIGDEAKFAISKTNTCEWRLHITPNFEERGIHVNCNRFSYAHRKFEGYPGNLFEDLDLTLVSSFDRSCDFIIEPTQQFMKSHPLSCLIPHTKFMVHVFNIEQFMRP